MYNGVMMHRILTCTLMIGMYASARGDVGIVSVLVAAGADSKMHSHTGQTMKSIAAEKAHRDVVMFLEAFPDATSLQV